MYMIDESPAFYADFDPHGPELIQRARAVLERPDGRREKLAAHLAELPDVDPTYVNLERGRVTIGRNNDLDNAGAAALKDVLQALKPWRKGPFDLFGIHIDSEWDSSLKWRRLAPHLAPLDGRRVLDVGSSNGYYLFRMAAAKPKTMLGIEPYMAYYFQYLALQRLLRRPHLFTLPLKLEEMPAMENWFHNVFCMGILYHRRSPLDTLAQMNALMAKGGQLVLETLIIEGDGDTALCPRQRYARMRNVYFIPTVPCLAHWLARSGFDNIRCVDVTPTKGKEQRKTDWIDSDSLDTFLDPADRRLTVEGYPAPIRAVMIAEKR